MTSTADVTATRAAERVLLDTNVLLAATDEGRPEHRAALALFQDWPAQGTALYTSGQVLREYLVVATRPRARNGLGMEVSDALANVAAFRGRLRFLPEDEKVFDRLAGLLDEAPCPGKPIHDAHVAATMLVHGVETIVTSNLADFARFGSHIRALPPG